VLSLLFDDKGFEVRALQPRWCAVDTFPRAEDPELVRRV
jgi:hypothetical protein